MEIIQPVSEALVLLAQVGALGLAVMFLAALLPQIVAGMF